VLRAEAIKRRGLVAAPLEFVIGNRLDFASDFRPRRRRANRPVGRYARSFRKRAR
jgi:hypothetical protein